MHASEQGEDTHNDPLPVCHISIKATNSTTILRIMRTVNLLLASATITVGVLAWIMGYVSSFQKVIAGIYIMYVILCSIGTTLMTCD